MARGDVFTCCICESGYEGHDEADAAASHDLWEDHEFIPPATREVVESWPTQDLLTFLADPRLAEMNRVTIREVLRDRSELFGWAPIDQSLVEQFVVDDSSKDFEDDHYYGF